MGIDIATISNAHSHTEMHITQTYLDEIESDEIDKANELITE